MKYTAEEIKRANEIVEYELNERRAARAKYELIELERKRAEESARQKFWREETIKSLEAMRPFRIRTSFKFIAGEMYEDTEELTGRGTVEDCVAREWLQDRIEELHELRKRIATLEEPTAGREEEKEK